MNPTSTLSRRCLLFSAAVALSLIGACSDRDPTGPPDSERPALTVAELATDSTALASGQPVQAQESSVTITISEGADAVVTVTSASTARCETVGVSGAINDSDIFPLGIGGCGGGESDNVGQVVTIGPAAADGILDFSISSSSASQSIVSGEFPSYTVAMDDGLFDFDFDDVVLSVEVMEGDAEVVCNPDPVERGSEVSCVVRGANVDEVLSWKFTAGAHSHDPNLTEREWSGIAVLSGEVVAKIRKDGKKKKHSLTDSISVMARQDWTWDARATENYQENIYTLPNPACEDIGPYVMEPYANAHYEYGFEGANLAWSCHAQDCGCLRRVQPDINDDNVEPDSVFRIMRVSEGPNATLWYVSDVEDFRTDALSSINHQLLPGGDKFPIPDDSTGTFAGQAQACRDNMPEFGPGDSIVVNFYEFNDLCMNNVTINFLAGLLDHEGYGSNLNNGHESYARATARQLEYDPFVRIEGRVKTDSLALYPEVFTELNLAQSEINGSWICEGCVGGNYDQDLWEHVLPLQNVTGFIEFRETDF